MDTPTPSEPIDVEAGWQNVIEQAKLVCKSYGKLLESSRDLAGAMLLNKDLVVRRVFPKNSGERTDIGRIMRWVESEQDFVRELLKNESEFQKQNKQRSALLKRLNLTPEEIILLGLNE